MCHVRTVLACLRQHQLYAKAEKCEFHKNSTTFLPRQGVEMDLKKVTVVMDWPELTTVKRGQLLLYSNKASPSRELLSIKAVLEEWRHWLEGARHLFLVLTDHRNLEYLHNAKRLNPCQALWVLFFTRFQFSVIYHLGTKNSNADALSWRHDLASTPAQPESILSPSIVLAPIRWNLEEEMQQALVNKPLPPTCLAIKLYVPSALRPRVLQWVHEAPSSGHHGIRRTLALAQNRFC
ncbi:hypothetical protein QTP86_027544 [Hemibagrus guttatus]|nr:hypothetical protein QTP86_027544 [Hemibagrus guttatus]